MKLLFPDEYIKDATQQVNKATRRVRLLALVIADHPATHSLIVALEAAARRGVDVAVSADVITYGEVSGGWLPLRYYSPSARLATQMAKTLKAAGVKFHWLGRARSFILNGRTHNKWCIADDTVYSFGGVNIYQQGIENIDYMFKVVDAGLADRLSDEQDRIQKAELRATNYPSTSYTFGDDTVLIDGGIIGHSIIYRHACELAAEAKEVLFVSQYCPTGRLARLLKKTDTTFYFNRPRQARSFNRWLIQLNMWLSGIQTTYKRKPYLHAKFLIFTLQDGSQVAMTGSHNFAYTSVLFGTRETVLETRNPKIIKQLLDFHRQHIS